MLMNLPRNFEEPEGESTQVQASEDEQENGALV